ncbi:hypothetical protein LTR53_006187 [Teratosphaeriaceae sp. CCFEE 6253]|nr:hypothetical protein LTR53_006187 [Teratosphaeriaceae sp. CCFEE 6253]
MTTKAWQYGVGCTLGGIDGPWSGVVDVSSRTPSPAPRPAKRARQSYEEPVQKPYIIQAPSASPDELSQAWIDRGLLDDGWLDVGDDGLDATWMHGYSNEDFSAWLDDFPNSNTSTSAFAAIANEVHNDPRNGTLAKMERKTQMQTGCIPCLVQGLRCDPRNPTCRRAMSTDWNLNRRTSDPTTHDDGDDVFPATPESTSLSAFRPDPTWRRSWRERHSLNFFVHFTAPQMAGFFDSAFWQRLVIQTSYHEPAILHAITAIGALHEAIMQRALADERRKAAAMEFALGQCNRAIASLTGSTNSGGKTGRRAMRIPDNRLALTTCVLFTCFEAMQGRCDSAVNHALQGRRLLQASSSSNHTAADRHPSNPHNPAPTPAHYDDDALEQMRPLVERLEVQATALLDKGKRPSADLSTTSPNHTAASPSDLPPVALLFSLEHAHNALHTALNNIMRFMQAFHPSAPRAHIAASMAEKSRRFAPWFSQWETAFTAFLAGAARDGSMGNLDFKRAMVLKANHLVGSMLASVDQSAGPVAYDPYEEEFKAIVDLSREVLASYSCPPLPTLSGGAQGAPYLSFSLWVTDPLWMAISRCRNPGIRQAAFTLLSQNPRQEGIWHAGPQVSRARYARRGTEGVERKAAKVGGRAGGKAAEGAKEVGRSRYESADGSGSSSDSGEGGDGETGYGAGGQAGQVNDRGSANGAPPPKARREWVDLRAQVQDWAEHEPTLTTAPSIAPRSPPSPQHAAQTAESIRYWGTIVVRTVPRADRRLVVDR